MGPKIVVVEPKRADSSPGSNVYMWAADHLVVASKGQLRPALHDEADAWCALT